MAGPQTALTSLQIASLVAGSSVLAAVVTQGVSWFRDHLKSKGNSDFAKVYLIAALEGYAAEASNSISDSENYEASDGATGRPVSNIPTLDAFTDKIEWRALGADTTKQMLRFQVDIEEVRASISFEWDVIGDEDFILPTVREKTALVGLRALQLAATLQGTPEVAPIALADPDWSVKSALEADHNKYEGLRLGREARQQKMVDELSANALAIVSAPDAEEG
ncbi:MAG: hypothetical protein WBA51_02935 [Erythrobacter sp.]